MKLPSWYWIACAMWLPAAPSFWWFAMGFNGLPFFTLPKLAGPSEGAGWQISLILQLVIYAALLAPITALPFALFAGRRASVPGRKTDA
jgi:hypothetical protein